MEAAFGYMIAIIFLVIIFNFFFLYKRLKRDHTRKPSREVLEEQKAAVLRDREIKRRLDREQEEDARYVELRNNMFDLYEQVRRKHAAADATTGTVAAANAIVTANATTAVGAITETTTIKTALAESTNGNSNPEK